MTQAIIQDINTIDHPLTSREAKYIIRSVGESGLPPNKGVAYYNVGNDSLLRTLHEEYFDEFLKDGGATFKLVIGDYGAGKSHFLLCVRDLAWRHGFVVSKTNLSPKECPYDNQLAVYQSVARNMIWHNEDMTVEDDAGIDVFLENHFNQICGKLGIEGPFEGQKFPPELSEWLKSIRQAKVESRSFQYAVFGFFEALARGDEAQQALLASYLRGEPITAKETQAFNVNEKMDKGNAFRMLRSLCQMLHELGYGGTILLFDEGDRMVSIGSSKQEKVACDNLREVVDCCADKKLPGAMFMYAVPPRFVNDIAPKYEALRQRVGRMSDVFSRRNPLSPIINLEKLDLPGDELLRQIGSRLLAIFETAYTPGFNKDLQGKNIQRLAARCAEMLSDHHRREFVKTLVNFFNKQRIDGELEFEDEKVISEIRKAHDATEDDSKDAAPKRRGKEY